jgi:putative ABC transport system substrate-binding protein
VELPRADQLDAAFDEIVRHRAGAVLVWGTAVTYSERVRLAALALRHRLPTIFDLRENVDAGGLMFYGVQPIYRVERSAYYVDRILRGAKPADLPIEQPTKLDLIINLRTAKALGLTVPPAVLARADEVIE